MSSLLQKVDEESRERLLDLLNRLESLGQQEQQAQHGNDPAAEARIEAEAARTLELFADILIEQVGKIGPEAFSMASALVERSRMIQHGAIDINDLGIRSNLQAGAAKDATNEVPNSLTQITSMSEAKELYAGILSTLGFSSSQEADVQAASYLSKVDNLSQGDIGIIFAASPVVEDQTSEQQAEYAWSVMEAAGLTEQLEHSEDAALMA